MNLLKIALAFFVTFLIISNLSFAQTEEDLALEELPNPGTTPDNFFYFFDVLFDAVEIEAVGLMYGPEAKIEKGLQVSNERLSELKAMSEKNNFVAMDVAKREYGGVLGEVKEEFVEIETDSEQELRKVIEIEKKLNDNRRQVKKLEEDLKIKIRYEGTITDDQKVLLGTVFDSLKSKNSELIIDIKNKKQITKIKIGEEGLEGNELEREFKHEMGILEEEKVEALSEIIKATEVLERVISETSDDEDGDDDGTISVSKKRRKSSSSRASPVTVEIEIEVSKDLISGAQFNFFDNNYEQARRDAEEARENLERLEEELGIAPTESPEEVSGSGGSDGPTPLIMPPLPNGEDIESDDDGADSGEDAGGSPIMLKPVGDPIDSDNESDSGSSGGGGGGGSSSGSSSGGDDGGSDDSGGGDDGGDGGNGGDGGSPIMIKPVGDGGNGGDGSPVVMKTGVGDGGDDGGDGGDGGNGGDDGGDGGDGGNGGDGGSPIFLKIVAMNFPTGHIILDILSFNLTLSEGLSLLIETIFVGI